MNLLYIDTILLISLILLVSICIGVLYRLHRKSCVIYEKQIEIEKQQVELKHDLKSKKSNSIFG